MSSTLPLPPDQEGVHLRDRCSRLSLLEVFLEVSHEGPPRPVRHSAAKPVVNVLSCAEVIVNTAPLPGTPIFKSEPPLVIKPPLKQTDPGRSVRILRICEDNQIAVHADRTFHPEGCYRALRIHLVLTRYGSGMIRALSVESEC